MHPGWVDTPLGLQTSMKNFYEKIKNYLRNTTQGDDMVLWAAFSKAVDDILSYLIEMLFQLIYL